MIDPTADQNKTEKMASALEWLASANNLLVATLRLLVEDETLDRAEIIDALKQANINNRRIIAALRIVGTLK